ncbi:MAG TPA: hypothetical protein VHX44_12765, partial [Planctomycetota bacterium]|nr:hypothetical protein [Planctomycetota bacterium]
NGEGFQEYPKGLWRLTMVSSYGVVSPTSANANQPGAHRSRYTTGYWNDGNDLKRFFRETENRRSLTITPEHWPTTEVTTQHFIKTGRFVNLARVQMHNPLSGATTEVVFTAFGTTLRGARLQRRHPKDYDGDNHWVDHDNRVGVVDRLTLDDTP